MGVNGFFACFCHGFVVDKFAAGLGNSRMSGVLSITLMSLFACTYQGVRFLGEIKAVVGSQVCCRLSPLFWSRNPFVSAHLGLAEELISIRNIFFQRYTSIFKLCKAHSLGGIDCLILYNEIEAIAIVYNSIHWRNRF